MANQDSSAVREFLARLADQAAQAQIGGVVERLRQMGHILFIGVGNSSILARYGARYLCNVGCFATAIDDPFTPIGSVVNTQARFDRVAGVARSGAGGTGELLGMVTALKERGCTIVSITNSASCTLARMSDHNLNYYMTDVRLNGYFQLTCQAPVICLLEMIGRRLYQPGPHDTFTEVK